ncbi:MAG: hypothetical protein JO250_05950 [Armatimonadetes bacterium]|nr:hypothetical protein [Armatimonadota bacterium]
MAGYRSGRHGSAPAAPRPAPVAPPAAPRGAGERAERQLLRALVGGDSALAEQVLNGITPDEFWTPLGRALAERLYAAHAADFEPDMRQVLAALEAEEVALANALTDLLMNEGGAPLEPRMLADDMARLKRRGKEQLLLHYKDRIDQGLADAALLTEYRRMFRELKGAATP